MATIVSSSEKAGGGEKLPVTPKSSSMLHKYRSESVCICPYANGTRSKLNTVVRGFIGLFALSSRFQCPVLQSKPIAQYNFTEASGLEFETTDDFVV